MDNDKKNGVSPFTFLEYDKITDAIMWLAGGLNIKFSVMLGYKDKNGNPAPFHTEFITRGKEYDKLTIRRDYKWQILIENIRSKDYVILNPNDVAVLQMVMNDVMIPWFNGNKRIFGEDNYGNLVVKKKNQRVNFPLNNGMYISFTPLVITFDDDTKQEGVRLEMNNPEQWFDITVDKLFEFIYFINNTDMVGLAASMVNYVKIRPYGSNLKDLRNLR